MSVALADEVSVETPEVAVEVETPVVEEIVEEVVETPEVEATEATVTEEVTEPTDTLSVEPPIEFLADDPEVNTKITEVIEKYELPPDVQSVIEFYKVKAEQPPNAFAEYAEYGEPEDIKALLDRQALLDSVTQTEDGAQRPSTDKFALSLPQEKAEWLFHDVGRLPSQKYKGLNLFEEALADTFAVEGDTVGAVLARYKETVGALQSGTAIKTSVPEFIPSHLQEAYWSLPKAEREAMDMFDPSTDRIEYDDNGRAVNIDEPMRNDKLRLLQQIQKGIDGDRILKEQEVQSKVSKEQQFQQGIIGTQTKFYETVRQTFTQDLLKNVTFSTDPKMQTMLAHQNVALLTEAFSDESEGEWARQALTDAGISFDYAKAQGLMKDVETASVALEWARQIKDANGNPVNQVEFNKAKNAFERTGKNWQLFQQDIVNQLAKLTSTGTTKAVDDAADKKIEKQKIQAKARPGTKGTASPVHTTKSDSALPSHIRPMTPEADEWYADREMERRARMVAAYQ